MKTIRVKLKKGVINKGLSGEDLFYPTDAVLEMEPLRAEYLIGTNVADLTMEECTPEPRPLIVPPRDQAVATGEALAKALKEAFPVPIQAKLPEPKKAA